MTDFGDEKPSLEEALVHYGVLGMKWGKTRRGASGKEIKEARINLNAKQGALFKAQNDLAKKKKAGTATAGDKARVDKMTTDFLKNPDRAVAGRLTNGEKAVLAIFATPAGAAASIAISSGVSRRIERKQETGAYDKK